jgi:CCR4-NOT transcription complex subunit 7/8
MSDNMGMMDQLIAPMPARQPTADPNELKIIDVWEDNFFEQLDLIKALIPQYNYIAMDTEFPGVVEVPRKKTDDYQYQLCKVNVDTLKMIQLGITLFDSEGNVPPGPCTWQFNFEFNIDEDKSLKQSMDVLKDAGIKFPLLKTHGIDIMLFAEYFLTSGLVFNDDLTWI